MVSPLLALGIRFSKPNPPKPPSAPPVNVEATLDATSTARAPAVALPFGKESLTKPVAPPSALPDLPPIPSSNEEQTVGLDGEVLSPFASAALPFRPPSPSEAPSPARDAAPPGEAAGARLAAPDTVDDVAGTCELPSPIVGHTPRTDSTATPDLEQYAWLCACREAEPAAAKRSSIAAGAAADDARRTTDEAWQRYLSTDPALKARFEQLLAHYRACIAQGRRS